MVGSDLMVLGSLSVTPADSEIRFAELWVECESCHVNDWRHLVGMPGALESCLSSMFPDDSGRGR